VQARPLPVDAVLFDLDGTLADTAPDLAAALNRVRGDRGLPPLPYPVLRPHASCGARGLIGAGLGIGPEHDEFPALRDAFLAHYAAALCVESALFADVGALLDAIEARGLPWGIVTNKAARFTQPLIDLLPPLHRAGTVVSGDTTAHAKPHPAPLLHAASELGIAAERCLYVGDALRDVEAGNAAGMVSIVAVYGYIEPHEAPDEWPAAGMIDRPGALLDWLPPVR
jgi:phosphoglycolate phosphatase